MSLRLFESWIFQRECFGSRERLLRVVYFQTTFFLPRPPCPRLSISGKSSRPGEGRRFVLEYSAHALYAGHLLVSCCTSTSYPLGKIPGYGFLIALPQADRIQADRISARLGGLQTYQGRASPTTTTAARRCPTGAASALPGAQTLTRQASNFRKQH